MYTFSLFSITTSTLLSRIRPTKIFTGYWLLSHENLYLLWFYNFGLKLKNKRTDYFVWNRRQRKHVFKQHKRVK